MDTNIWKAETISDAILKNNANLEMVFANYLKAFIVRLREYDINLQGINSIEILQQKVVEGIEQLELMRNEFLSVIEMFSMSRHPLLQHYLPDFFEQLLNFYEEQGVNLYTSTSADSLKNDHFRFFNQHLFISLAAMLVENRCFDALQAILHAKFKVYNNTYGRVRDINFIRLCSYNYTLNQFLNTGSPKRISITADYILKFSPPVDFGKLVKADILLYYISLWYHTGDIIAPYWMPELSVYNRDRDILPKMVSKSYFEKAKGVFGVGSIEEYKKLLDKTPDIFERNGIYHVPLLKVGLMYDTVGTDE